MTPSLTDTLCTRCGMCCDGTLFADVELVGRPEAMRLELMGLDVDGDESDVGLLSQPCAALKGTRCGIYEHRPRCCRVFECQLLQDAKEGAVPVAEALEQIVEARRRIHRVRELLIQLGDRDARLPLKERCAEVLARDGPATPEVTRRRVALEAAMADVERILWQSFVGSGSPR